MTQPNSHASKDVSPIVRFGPQKEIPEMLYGMFGALLFRSQDLGSDIDQVLRGQGVILPERPYHVVLISLSDPKINEMDDRHSYQIEMYCEIRTHMIQQMNPQDEGIFVLMNGFLIGLVYSDTAQLAQCCEGAVRYAKEHLGLTCHSTMSSAWTGIENIEQAHRMVQDAEYSRRFYGDLIAPAFCASEDMIARLTDKAQHLKTEQEFFPSTERICGTVRAGDQNAAAGELRKQLKQIAETCIGLPYPDVLNLSVNRFFSLLQFRLSEQKLADWRYLAEMDFSRELISCGTLTEFLDASDSIARRLIAHARERMDQGHARLMREIWSYLEENAADMNIGLTAVARNFHITPREAAESFRQFYGISVNDVIHRARVKMAKELLLNTNDSVQEIASKVGYCSLATMYRAFTSIEGVAPGKLRQNRSGQTRKNAT